MPPLHSSDICIKQKAMKKTWFITGSSRGLGRSLAEAVLEKGDQLAATSRNSADLHDLVKHYPGQVLPLTLDVSKPTEIKKAVDDTIKHFGRIDVLVNNAGFGITGAAEGFTEDQVTRQLDVNLYAPIAVTRAVLPHMRRQGEGRILQVSSVGGRVGNAGLTMYQAAKFGLSGFSEALSKEVKHLGIFVTCVEPGGFRTDWAGISMTFAPDVPGYEQVVGGIKAFMTSGKFVPMGDPAKAAQAMIAITAVDNPPVHLVLGSEAVQIVEAADDARRAELEKWKSISLSTDHDDAVNIFEHPEARTFLASKGLAE
jgi:NAD(P)-dependent dehydrogenase (short-subunit alcohol dehydrogenase family)